MYMELRERIDVSPNIKDLLNIEKELCKLIDSSTKSLITSLESHQYDEAKKEIARLKFLYSIENSLLEKKK